MGALFTDQLHLGTPFTDQLHLAHLTPFSLTYIKKVPLSTDLQKKKKKKKFNQSLSWINFLY